MSEPLTTTLAPLANSQPTMPKAKFRHSLQWRLVVTLTIVVLLFSCVVAGLGAWQGYKQAQKLQDMKLASLVSLAKSHDLTFQQDQVNVNFNYDLPSLSEVKSDNDRNAIDIELFNNDKQKNRTIIYWLHDPRLQSFFGVSQLEALKNRADGLYDIQTKTGGWRVYLFTADPHNADNNLLTRRLLVAEKSGIRHTLAWQSAKQIILPLLLLIPLLVLVLVLTINQLFLPLRTVTEILQHSANSPQKLAKTAYRNDLSLLINDDLVANLPTEIQPFLRLIQQQINDLMTMMASNQRFIANASHQLRTPMTAVLLQAEQLKNLTVGTPNFEQAVDELLASIKRNNHLMNQLLLLAKTEQLHPFEKLTAFSTSAIISQLLIDYYPLAEQKQLNLGVDELMDVQLPISELGFNIIAQNLIENAIKYTPSGGSIDVAVYQQVSGTTVQAVLSVKDTGQGIEEADIAKVLEPFYQTQTDHTANGFGLGLSIVSNLIANSGGKLMMQNRYPPSQPTSITGLDVTVTWDITV